MSADEIRQIKAALPKTFDGTVAEFKELLDQLSARVGDTESPRLFFDYSDNPVTGGLTAYVWRRETEEERAWRSTLTARWPA